MTDSFSLAGNPEQRPSPSAIDETGSPKAANCDVVVSCRVSLSRNLASFPFLDTCSQEQRTQIHWQLLQGSWTKQNQNHFQMVDCDRLKLLERQFLIDLQALIGLRGLLEPGDPWPEADHEAVNLAPVIPSENPDQPSPALSPNAESENLSIESDLMVRLIFNYEDHLRIDVESPDCDLISAWQLANQIDDSFLRQFSFAFHPTYGFLTASPAEAGTGLRLSVLLHLPAAVAMGTLPVAVARLGRSNMALREAFGDPGGGDFFRLNNQATLGISETELLDQALQAMQELVKAEQQARQQWLAASEADLKRKIMQSVPEFRRLRLNLSDSQTRWRLIRALSRLRLGQNLGWLKSADCRLLAGRFLVAQLKRWLQTAVANEDYRTASRLKKQIHQLGDSA